MDSLPSLGDNLDTFSTIFQVSGIANIQAGPRAAFSDLSTNTPTPAFFLRRITNPSGLPLTIGALLTARCAPAPDDPDRTNSLLFRGRISAVMSLDDKWAHLWIEPRPPIGNEVYFDTSTKPVLEPPVVLYTPRNQIIIPKEDVIRIQLCQSLRISNKPVTPPSPYTSPLPSPSSTYPPSH